MLELTVQFEEVLGYNNIDITLFRLGFIQFWLCLNEMKSGSS